MNNLTNLAKKSYHFADIACTNYKVSFRRGVICLSAIMLLFFTESVGQTKYDQQTGIVDKTEELKKNKAEWTLLEDKKKIDGYTRVGDSIFGGEIACNISPIKDVDVSTFAVYPGTKYAKDKNRVYYPISIRCVDDENCGVCYYEKVIIAKVNPSTFRYLGKDYATDGRYAYFRGLLIKGADGSTFKVIDGPEYLYFAKDKKCVYKYDKALKGADPSSFHYKRNDLRNKMSESDSKYIMGDKDKEWEYTPPDEFKRL